ncbi:MAG: 50S ribosomal protein L29 [Desulfurococcales archaeon]|nr:50S ribosomal protein L29 [Desulfurococcales archaeon]
MAKHKVKPSELREKDPKELEELLREFRTELIVLRHKASVGVLENPGRLRELKRNIARILTILNEKRTKG